MLAQISKRYFCVQKQSTRNIISFIKENIVHHVQKHLQQLLNSENKIHYPTFENSKAGLRRPHKKSLSDCGDISLNFEEEMRDKTFHDGSENGTHERYSFLNHRQNSIGEFYPHNYQDTNGTLNEAPRLERQSSNLPSNKRSTGRLKFFDQNGNYGFIVVDGLNSDLFVHYDDLSKAGISKDRLMNIRNSEEMRFQFTCLEYDGKYKKSKKAVDLIQLIP